MGIQCFDRNRNEDIQEKVGVPLIEEKMSEHWLRWFGHIQCRLVNSKKTNIVSGGRYKKRERSQKVLGRKLYKEFEGAKYKPMIGQSGGG